MIRPYSPDHKPAQATLPEPKIGCGPIAESEKDYWRAVNAKSRADRMSDEMKGDGS